MRECVRDVKPECKEMLPCQSVKDEHDFEICLSSVFLFQTILSLTHVRLGYLNQDASL